jgi:phosphate transport system permease protein
LSRSRSDAILVACLRTCAVVAGTIVLFILCFLIKESWPALSSVGLARFFTDPSWHPREDEFGLWPMLLGTLAAMAGSVLLATPIGIMSAVFCHYYAPPRLAGVLRTVLGLLAGIPSVVYGFWGLVVLVPKIAEFHPPGPSLLAAILILTIMILPTIALMADSSLSNIPSSYVQGAAALGLSRWATIQGVVIPAARSGLFTGIILQTGRAIGETMAVLMVAGNIVQTPDSLFAPVRTLTANVALEMAYAMGIHRSSLFVSGLVLLVVITALVALAEWTSHGRIYE